MNVTIKIDEEDCRKARHRAVDLGLSLSGWVTKLIHRELMQPITKPKSLLEALGNEQLAGRDVKFPRTRTPSRNVDFS